MSGVRREQLIDIEPEHDNTLLEAAEVEPLLPEKARLDGTARAYARPVSSSIWLRERLGLPLWLWLGVVLVFSTYLSHLINETSISSDLQKSLVRLTSNTEWPQPSRSNREADERQCRLAEAKAGPPPQFSARTVNDRFMSHIRPTIIQNATLWTGEEIIQGVDISLDQGLIVSVERTEQSAHRQDTGANVIHAHGRWVTPGIIDMHTHLGVMGMPSQPSTTDDNSRVGPTRPMVRSLDGFNEHDQNLHSTIGGGVTTALVLPGSLDNIGGQAYPIKLGALHGRPPSSRVLDPPRSLVMPGERYYGRDALYDEASGMHRGDNSTSFRHLKMACGENARKYGLVRMDEAWNFRREFERAAKLRRRQDDFCAALRDGKPTNEPSFPVELELDSLVDVLRGRTKVHTHCYTMNDLDAIVRHSTEFEFPIAAFHHAHETYLVPELLHKAYGNPPAVAMFSTNANYKYESYFGSPFAGALLRASNITPIYKSDHPVLDSRRLLHQAAEAHHYGLDEISALKSVTSAPAHVLGLAHRIGHVRVGADADLVLWDRHPLHLGATPMQVFVDGEAQLTQPTPSGADVTRSKPQSRPRQPDYSVELARVQAMEPVIIEDRALAFPSVNQHVQQAVLYNVRQYFHRKTDAEGTRIVAETFEEGDGVLVYSEGSLVCVGTRDCLGFASEHARRVDLHNGVVIPGLISYGGLLGIADLPSERSAQAGKDVSDVDDHAQLQPRITPRAADELTWGAHDMLRAHASGVTTAINAPAVKGVVGGISAHFDTHVRNILDPYSVRASDVALHVHLSHSGPSLGSQLGLLRRALKEPPSCEWRRVAAGTLPLVVKADAQALVAQLVLLRKEFPRVRLVIDSLGPLHLVAHHLAANNIGVLIPNKVWYYEWDSLGRLRGPPFSNDTEIGVLLRHGVRVAVRIEESWEAANLLWETAWAAQEAHITDPSAILELMTTKYVLD